MKSYLELRQQAEKLLAEAEEVRQKEVKDVIADIRQKMEAYGLSVHDLGLAGAAKPKAGRSTSPAKYRGPNGQTWSGGRGRKPDWILEAIKKGESIEKFAIKH